MSEVSEYLDKRLDRIDDKVDRVIEKVDQLIKFKWQIIGGAAVVSAVISLVMLVAFGVK